MAVGVDQHQTTEALVANEPGAPFRLQQVRLSPLRPKELLVDIKYSGICHTDLVVQAGHMPLSKFPVVLGHEGAGVIRQLGDGLADSGLREGDRVILGFCSCMSCTACKDGRNGACESIAPTNFVGTRGDQSAKAISDADGRDIHGTFFGQSSFSRLAIVDSRAVIKYDGPVENLAFLAPLGCGYMTGAATVLNVLRPKPSHSLAILGLGAVGLSALMAAKNIGLSDIIALDILDCRLRTATRLGASQVANSKQYESIEVAIRERCPRGVDYIIDATGSTPVIESGIRALAHGGTFAIVGTPKPEETIQVDAMPMLTQCRKLIGVTGGYCDPKQFIPQLLDMFNSGKLPLDELHKLYSVNDIEKAIRDMKSGEVVKPVLAW